MPSQPGFFTENSQIQKHLYFIEPVQGFRLPAASFTNNAGKDIGIINTVRYELGFKGKPASFAVKGSPPFPVPP